MLTKIILENFMSHAYTEIDLAEGLTVLVGPNNCGKSALVAALQILANNGNTTHVIRHGEKTARVTALTDDGHTIVWQRKKTSVSYTIDGEDIHRVGQKTPDRLHDSLRLASVETDDGKNQYDIHFGEQKSPVFLLNESGNRAASFFASSSDAALLIEMQAAHKLRVRDAKREHRQLSASVSEAEAAINRLTPVDAMTERLRHAQMMDQRIGDDEQLATSLKQCLSDLHRLKSVRDRHQNTVTALAPLGRTQTNPQDLIAADVERERLLGCIESLTNIERRRTRLNNFLLQLKTLRQPPAIELTGALSDWLRQRSKAKRRQTEAGSTTKSLSNLTSPPSVDDTGAHQDWLKRYRDASSSRQAFAAVTDRLKNLSPTPALEDVSKLATVIGRMIDAQKTAKRCTKRCRRLESLSAPPASVDCTAIRQLCDSFIAAKQVIKQRQQSLVEMDEKLVAAETMIRAFVAENPKCQTCGAELQPENLLSAAGAMHQHAKTDSDRGER